MKKILITILLFIFTSVYADNFTEPIKIQADSMQYFGEKNQSKFTGNVVAVSESYTLTSDKVDVFFTGKNDVTKVICKGNVNFKSKDIVAVAKTGELDQPTKTITLKGNVKVWQGDNYLEGENVRVQYITKEIFVDKGNKDKVTVIFSPDDKKNDSGSAQ